MKLNHFIIEGFCPEHKGKSLPCKNSFQFSMECYRCPEFSYAPSPLELAFSDKDGIVRTLDDWCGFGGAMLPARNEAYWKNIWQDICREKIKEANDAYLSLLMQSPDYNHEDK